MPCTGSYFPLFSLSKPTCHSAAHAFLFSQTQKNLHPPFTPFTTKLVAALNYEYRHRNPRVALATPFLTSTSSPRLPHTLHAHTTTTSIRTSLSTSHHPPASIHPFCLQRLRPAVSLCTHLFFSTGPATTLTSVAKNKKGSRPILHPKPSPKQTTTIHSTRGTCREPHPRYRVRSLVFSSASPKSAFIAVSHLQTPNRNIADSGHRDRFI